MKKFQWLRQFFAASRFKNFEIVFIANLICANVQAQLVKDSTSATFGPGTTNISGNLIIGTNGSFTSLTITSGGFVTNDGSGIIGQNSTSRSNRVMVTGANSTWNNGNTLNIGSAGSFNLLIITNGGTVSDRFGNISLNNGSSNNAVIVTGSGSLWTTVNAVNVGSSGPSNRVVVANGGFIVSSSAVLGNSVASRSNEVVITDAGSQWKTFNGFSLGPDSSLNFLVVSNGGGVISGGVYLGAKSTGSGSGNSNRAVITGANSTWTNSENFAIGDFGSSNQFTISNGAVVRNTFTSVNSYLGRQPSSSNNVLLVTGANSLFSSGDGTVTFTRLSVGLNGSGNQLLVRNGATVEVDTGAIGDGGAQNTAVVEDSGSTWRNFKTLYVGQSGNSSQLFVSDNGTVLATNLILGNLESSSNNSLVVLNGNLFITNSAKSGALDIRRGLMTLDSGLVATDNLLLTNGNSSELDFYAGTLRTRNTTVSSGSAFVVGGLDERPTLELIGSGVHTFASGLSLSADATLIGSGSIVGNVISAGTLYPGNTNAIGHFEISGTLALQSSGTNLFELNKSSGTNDSIGGMTSVNYGGVLGVTNLGGTLSAGDTFQLFAASNYSGAFSSVTLPTLSAGLFWKTNLTIDGTIAVSSQATSTQLNNLGNDAKGAFHFSFTNAPGANFSILTTTNIALPLTNWTILSGVIETSPGQYQFTDSQATNFPQRFYLLRSP